MRGFFGRDVVAYAARIAFGSLFVGREVSTSWSGTMKLITNSASTEKTKQRINMWINILRRDGENNETMW